MQQGNNGQKVLIIYLDMTKEILPKVMEDAQMFFEQHSTGLLVIAIDANHQDLLSRIPVMHMEYLEECQDRNI